MENEALDRSELYKELGLEALKAGSGAVTFYGTLGTGRACHPWDDLALCSKCGGYPYMVGKDGQDFHSGPPYRIKCLECGCSSILSDDISLIRKDWMGKIDDEGENK